MGREGGAHGMEVQENALIFPKSHYKIIVTDNGIDVLSVCWFRGNWS